MAIIFDNFFEMEKLLYVETLTVAGYVKDASLAACNQAFTEMAIIFLAIVKAAAGLETALQAT